MRHTTAVAIAMLSSVITLAACGKTPYTMTDGGPNNPAKKGELHKVDFDASPPGPLPSAFAHVLGDWKVQGDGAGRVLAQTGDFGGDDFPRIILKDIAFTIVHVKVRCRMIDGDDDRACGLMFRVKDSDNYYLTRANALEDNVRFYKVIGGDRKELAGRDMRVTPGDWHTYEAFMEGTHVRIVYDGKEVLSFDDAELKTGKVGLWTKADSVTAFDDFEATEL
jgi:hypothetical protein